MEEDVVSTGIGLKCDDGIVLGTDTQHTGAWKTKGEKLFEITGGQGVRLLFAGAGNVSHIRKAVQIMGAAVANAGKDLDLDNVIELTESTLTTIYKKYIDTYPVAEEIKPHLSLLVGVWSSHGGLALLTSERTTVIPVDDYATVGTGGPLVQYIVETLRGYSNTVAEAKLLALYALKAAKDYDLFSGKETRLKTLYATGQIETASSEEIGNAEVYFDGLLSAINTVLTAVGLEMPSEDIESLADLKRTFSEFRERERTRKEKEAKYHSQIQPL
jgi:20S proteasome alpha/beta subunit